MKFTHTFLSRMDNSSNMLTAFITISFISLSIQRSDASSFLCKKKYHKQLESSYETPLTIWPLLSLEVPQKLTVNYCLCCNIYFHRFSNCNITVLCVIIPVYRYVSSSTSVKSTSVDSAYIYNTDISYPSLDCWINSCLQKKKHHFFMAPITCPV